MNSEAKLDWWRHKAYDALRQRDELRKMNRGLLTELTACRAERAKLEEEIEELRSDA